MAWTEPIDGYCERLGPAFWAEPANAVSNLAFFAAAFLAFAAWRKAAAKRGGQGRRDVASLLLILLVAVIGTGSFLFHTLANRWSSLADVIPIAIFIYGYFGLALYRFVGLGRILAAVGMLIFIGLSPAVETLAEPILGSSAGYAPALLALYGIGLWLLGSGRAPARLVLAAGLVFTVSLGLRMADAPLCEALPIGTHFLWHILNAATLGLLLLASIRQGVRQGGPPLPA